MPQNMPEQILQRIVRLSADGNSQREVARMLGVSQGCISKILRRNRENGRPHQKKRGGSMKISTPQEDRQLLRMVRTSLFISAPRLRMQMTCRFGRRMSVRTIGIWPPDIGLRVQLNVLGSLRSTGDAAVSLGRRHRVLDLRQWRHCIFSDESWFSLHHSDGGVRCRQGESMIDAFVQPNGMGCNPPWGEEWAGRGGWSHEPASVHPDPEISNASLWRRGCLDVTLCTPKTMPRPIQYARRQPIWTNRILRSWTGQFGVQTWTQLSMFGIKCQSDPRHGWHPLPS